VLHEEFLKILDQARLLKLLIVYVLDLFSCDSSFSNDVNEKIKDLDIHRGPPTAGLVPKVGQRRLVARYVLSRAKRLV
jgi:hypothetical protein